MFVLQYQGLHDLLAPAGAAWQGASAVTPAAESGAFTHVAALPMAVFITEAETRRANHFTFPDVFTCGDVHLD